MLDNGQSAAKNVFLCYLYRKFVVNYLKYPLYKLEKVCYNYIRISKWGICG